MPLNEDYGYVTVEAFLSGKPVITMSDSGGPLEFVSEGQSGLVSASGPDALAETIERLWTLPQGRLREMGAAGREVVRDITWDTVFDRLTEALR